MHLPRPRRPERRDAAQKAGRRKIQTASAVSTTAPGMSFQNNAVAVSDAELARRHGALKITGPGRRKLRDWEQGKSEPYTCARAYLKVIARNPKAVTDALESAL